MPYDEQGNFYGSDEDLGALEAKYKKPDPVSQIPGQVSSSKPEESKSLRDQAAAALMKYNPLMIQKSLQDVPRTVVGGALLPVVAPISAGVQALNALPGNLLRRSRGEEEIKTPTTEELMQKYGQVIAPKTELGQNFQEGLSKTMDTLKIPSAWPMTPGGPKRPMLTPTDVRVGAGQIKQLAKELKETPQDFKAAQSGLKRQNLYGEDTIGVKAQAAADALGDTLERRRASDLSPIPGVPGVLTPETSMYAVRPKGSRLVQPKVPASAKNYTPNFSDIADYVDDVYGNVEAGEIPPTMIMSEYAPRFMNSEANRAFKQGVMELGKQKALEMFPDAPSETLAMRAYELLYSDRNARAAKDLETIEEFLAKPENQQFVEAGIPTPSEFLNRFKEAERVVKGPLVNYISKNVGAEGDPTVKLARQGITYETPERLNELAQYVSQANLASVRTEGGFPAMGSFFEERLAKTGELDKLNEEIAAIENIRTPLFNRAHEEGIDPATIPEYAETTNPLRQKLRQREQLQGELENIKLATSVENLSDYAVGPRSKARMLADIPYQERQFFPSVTKSGENETFYIVGNKSLLNDIGYQKLGKELVEDILTGKAGDTSKLTIENYIRDKHLTRVEAEKAAKLQQQQYRQNLESALLKRLQEDPTVQTFGNAAVITLNKDTPKEVALRDMSTDTAVLDHCVGQGGSAPQGRRNFLTNEQQTYEPIIDPVTGERNKNARDSAYSTYVDSLERGDELVSIRDAKTGLPAATIQLHSMGDPGRFRIGYASGARNGAIKPEYVDAIKQYLNSRSSEIYDTGSNLDTNAGIFDLSNSNGRGYAIRAAGIPGYNKGAKAKELERTLELAMQHSSDIPRFATSDDVKKIFAQIPAETTQQVVPAQAARPTGGLNLPDYDHYVNEFQSALESAAEAALENSSLQNPARVQDAMGREIAAIFDQHLNDPVEFVQNPVTHLRLAERDIQQAIERLHAEGSLVGEETARGLEDFLLDVRGLRGSIQRRLETEQDAAQANQAFNQRANQTLAENYENLRQGLQNDHDAGVIDLDLVDPNELLDAIRNPAPTSAYYHIPLEERRALADYVQQHGVTEPFRAAGEQGQTPDRFSLSLQYNIPPVTVLELQARFRDPDTTVANLNIMRDYAQTGAPRSIFANLPEESRAGAARMITDEIQRRQQGAAQNQVAVQGDRQVSARDRELLTMFNSLVDDAIEEGSFPAGMANGDLAQLVIDDEIGGLDDLSEADRSRLVELLNSPEQRAPAGQMLPAPAQPAPAPRIQVQDPVPREMQTLNRQDLILRLGPQGVDEAQRIAQQYFTDNTFDENTPVSAATNAIRSYNFGPHEGQPPMVRELAARELEELFSTAQQDASILASSLDEAMYQDMEGPQEAAQAANRDIRLLRQHGEGAWEDVFGPLAEDYPWSRTTQELAIQFLQEIADGYRQQLDEQGPPFARGGLVNRARTPMVVPRRSPELAEMAYRYGGMV